MSSKSNKKRSVDNIQIYSNNHPIEQKAKKEKVFVEYDDSKTKDEMRKDYKKLKNQKPKGKNPQRGGKRVETFYDD